MIYLLYSIITPTTAVTPILLFLPGSSPANSVYKLYQ